ncbi:MAG: hypothetical protein SFV54_11255 [Bryobacteraceae bacterium]|nr:hypothetical protein [Bryobacteraceae bacterium]
MTRRHWMMAAGATAAARSLRAGYEVAVEVKFDRKLQAWDGFGVNYVEAAQTRNYDESPQEYGGFSTLAEPQRQEILDLIFSPDGLKPGLMKMFLDCWHQRSPGGPFDHKKTTQWMRYFAREGWKRQQARKAGLEVITTLYGPPGWMTKQKFVRGRDLDPAHKQDLAAYIADWVKYLRTEEKLPVKYAALHNEGEDFGRWPTDGSWGSYARHDYNMYWHSGQVVEMMKRLRTALDSAGLKDVGVTPGETSAWDRFINWGYAWAIAEDADASKVLSLITSHGFGVGPAVTSMGNDLLRLKRPELHAWTTSMTWGQMDIRFLEGIRQQIYTAKVNGIIPWATIQTDTWVGGDPNPGTAFRVDQKGGYSVESGYWYFKHVCRTGQPGMAVAQVYSHDPEVQGIAFASNGTANPDAVTLLHLGTARKDLVVQVTGASARRFAMFVTDKKKRHEAGSDIEARNGALEVTIYPEQAVTFVARA